MDINQVITLGIGTPSDIPHFILVGLSPGSAPAADPTVLDLLGLYQPTLSASGRYQASISALGIYQTTIDLEGRVEH